MLALHLFHRKPTPLTLVTESEAVFYVTISSLWQTDNSHSFLPFPCHRLCSIRSTLLQQVYVKLFEWFT